MLLPVALGAGGHATGRELSLEWIMGCWRKRKLFWCWLQLSITKGLKMLTGIWMIELNKAWFFAVATLVWPRRLGVHIVERLWWFVWEEIWLLGPRCCCFVENFSR